MRTLTCTLDHVDGHPDHHFSTTTAFCFSSPPIGLRIALDQYLSVAGDPQIRKPGQPNQVLSSSRVIVQSLRSPFKGCFQAVYQSDKTSPSQDMTRTIQARHRRMNEDCIADAPGERSSPTLGQGSAKMDLAKVFLLKTRTRLDCEGGLPVCALFVL
jgi:hypothetical protein